MPPPRPSVSSCRYKRGTWPLSRVPHQWADWQGVAVEAMTGNRSPVPAAWRREGDRLGVCNPVAGRIPATLLSPTPHSHEPEIREVVRTRSGARGTDNGHRALDTWPTERVPSAVPLPPSHVVATFPPGAEHIHRSGCWGIRDNVF